MLNENLFSLCTTQQSQNSYECLTNYCANGVCGNLQKELSGIRDLLNKIIEFLKGLLFFGKGGR